MAHRRDLVSCIVQGVDLDGLIDLKHCIHGFGQNIGIATLAQYWRSVVAIADDDIDWIAGIALAVENIKSRAS